MENNAIKIASAVFRVEAPNLYDLPWGQPAEFWKERCPHLTDLPQGVARHPVVYINCHGNLFAVKEMAAGAAQKENLLLEQIESLHIPAVIPVGIVQLAPAESEVSYLVTRYLEHSLPYRSLFMNPTQKPTRINLLDAMAVLLVQLHLAGVYWGDCSLSNTLFRLDSGALQAYLVDAESAEIHQPSLPSSLRFNDLEIMEANITGEMLDLAQAGYIPDSATVYETGASIRQRYHNLWEEITFQEVVLPSETFRIQERIRKLNSLGFSVREVEFTPTEAGDKLRLKIIVADRSFHRNRLFGLTGLETEEMQARTLTNEIHELRATLERERGQSVPLDAAAFHWLEHIYQPAINRLRPLTDMREVIQQVGQPDLVIDAVELYCQVLEHKWYLSERAGRDVGHMAAIDDYLTKFGKDLHNTGA